MANKVPYELDALKQIVQQKFAEIRAALHMREKLLLRQLDVIAQQHIGCKTINADVEALNVEQPAEVKFLAEQEDDLLAVIRSFGRFQLGKLNLAQQQVYLRQEDYITPSKDHETMYKCLQQALPLIENEEQSEAISVDFAQNKLLMEANRRQMNESIINITLHEAKELIHRAKLKYDNYVPPLQLDELESSLVDVMSSLATDAVTNTRSSQTIASSKCKNRYKPKITINNCNGTINLRNIASLTINCNNEEAINAELPLPANTTTTTTTSTYNTETATTTNSNSIAYNNTNTTGNSLTGSDSTSKQTRKARRQKQSNNNKQHNGQQCAIVVKSEDEYDEETTAATRDFYNRLLNEINISLKGAKRQHMQKINHKQNVENLSNKCDVNDNEANEVSVVEEVEIEASIGTEGTTTTSTSAAQINQQFVLKNFENLKIVLETNNDEDGARPVQIEQWLAEIISASDLEPVANTDILEHSKIDSYESNIT